MEKLPPSENENLTATPWNSLSDVEFISQNDESMPPLNKEGVTHIEDSPIEIVEASPSNRLSDRPTTYYYDGKSMPGKEWGDTIKQDMAERRQEGKSVKVSDLPLGPINAPK